MDKTVIKYRHCGTDVYRFSCVNAAHCSCAQSECGGAQCPVCLRSLTFGLLDAPVALQCPFINGHKVSCAFLIGSVHGPLYLGEWHDTEIHVGLSNSEGRVYNYTLAGVQRDDRGWEQCVCIQLVPPWRRELRELWDRELEEFSARPVWVSERFEEEREFGSCCYGFALTFVNHMRLMDGKDSLSRDEFTESHVLPKMKSASTYIKIYYAIIQNGFYIANKLDYI